MPKQQVKIPLSTAVMIANGYQSLMAAIQYFRAGYCDPNCPELVKATLAMLNADTQLILSKLDKRIPSSKRQDFKEQVQDVDPLRMENIKSIYVRLTPEQQALLESVAEGLLKGEVIEVQQN